MPKLTKSLVNKLTWSGGQKRSPIWDTEVKGFGVRVGQSARKSFVFKYRFGARIRWFTIGVFGSPWTVDDARREARRLAGIVAEGSDPQRAKLEKRDAMTVSNLIDRYLTDGPIDKPNKRDSTWRSDRSNLERHVQRLIGHIPVDDLTPSDISRFQNDVASGKSAHSVKTKPRGVARVQGGRGTAIRTMVTLAAMLNWAVKLGLIDKNPAQSVDRLKSTRKARFLTSAEANRLLRTLDDMEADRSLTSTFADAARLILWTGARRSEIMKLHWNEVDFARSMAVLENGRAKTRDRYIVFGTAAIDLLARRNVANQKSPTPSNFVFPGTTGSGPADLGSPWKRIRKRAGLLDVRIHDLRHSFASFAVSQGASLFQVGKTLGHKRAASTEIYAHLHDHVARDVVENVEATLRRVRDVA